MLEKEYVLYHSKKKRYVAIDSKARPTFVFDPAKAKAFTHTAAKNFLRVNARGEFKNCRIEPVDEKVRQQLVPTVNAAVSQSNVLQKIIDDLSITVHDCDLKMVDLYHFAGNNPKLPAHRGYKIYKKLAELVQERAKAKAQIQAIKSAMTYEYVPYNPRTELYNELKNM